MMWLSNSGEYTSMFFYPSFYENERSLGILQQALQGSSPLIPLQLNRALDSFVCAIYFPKKR